MTVRGAAPPGTGDPVAGHSPALDGAAAVVGLVERLAVSHGRDDLAAELRSLGASLDVQRVEALVVGGPGQGKSAVVNALVGAPVCPEAPGGATTVPTTVSWGEQYRAAIWREPRAGEVAVAEEVPYAQAVGLAAGGLNPDNGWRLRSIDLTVPAPLLERGLTLVDTPSMQQVWSPDASRLLSAMGRVAVVVLVTSAASPLTPGELDLLRLAASACPRVVVVVNGTATYDRWRAVVDQDELELERRGVPAEVIALDAAPYWTDAGGLAPGPDPGMQRLAQHLSETAVLDREQSRISTAVTEAFWAADRLRLRLWAEQSLIGDTEAIDLAIARLGDGATEATALCAPDAGWRLQLDAATAQLRRDLRWDLDAERRRLIELAATMPTAPDDLSRAQFHRRLADAVAHLQRMRKLSLRALAKGVAERLADASAHISATLPRVPDAHALGLPRLDRLATPSPRCMERLGLRTAPPASIVEVPIAPEFHAWLDVALDLVQRENDAAVSATVTALRDRCASRAIELHRSLVEVRTAAHLLRDADPQVVLARRRALTTELERLATVDWQPASDG